MIEFILNYELSFFAIFSLLALLLSIYQKEEIYSYSNRLFKFITISTIIILTLEVLSWVFDGTDTLLAYTLNYGFNYLLILGSPIVPAIWITYIDYKVYNDPDRIRKRIFYLHGFLISSVLMIINIFTPIMFSIEEGNIYQRGNFLWVNVIFILGLLAYGIFITFKNRKQISLKLLHVVALFLLLPSAAMLIQMTNYGVILMWPALSIAIILAYLFLETTSSAKDHLTGLYNRSLLDDYVDRQIEKQEHFSVIMIDLDDYKKINDTHGHFIGDKMIIMFGKLLKTVFGDNSLVSRYGGDEFIIVTSELEELKLLELKEDMQKRIKEYDDELFKSVRFSFGFSSRTKNNDKDFDKLLIEADDMMYRDKAVNKNYKRRKGDR